MPRDHGSRLEHVGLLGTKWMMTGPVYAKALEKRGLKLSIPDGSSQSMQYSKR
ncbi:MAG: hypothetical protein L0Z52_08550 [Acidobacteria bacterium]|nr:hypothetical protein [Acidobacteriota bacterium]